MDSFGQDLFAPESLKEYRTRHNSNVNNNTANIDIDPAILNVQGNNNSRPQQYGRYQQYRPAQSSNIDYNQSFTNSFSNSRSDVRQGLNSQGRQQDITTHQYPTVRNSLPSPYTDRPSPYLPRQPTYLSRPSPYLPLDPFVPSSGSTHRDDDGSLPVISKKRNRNDANGEDDLEEPPTKSRRSMRRPMNSSKRRTRGDADLYNGSEGDEENRLAPPKPTERKRSRRTKANKYKHHGDEGEGEKEKRERKVSKYNQKIAEGKGPEKGSLGPKGVVRIRDGQMEFRDVNNPEWTLAAYHSEFRRQFLDEAAEGGDFDHEPTCGEADDDETSFEPEQQSWGPSRTDWQNIVNSRGEKVMFEVEKPANRRPPQEPGNWIHDGYVLLDSKNHPVKNWPGLNKTLSSEVEGWRWEAINRVYPWLTVADLLARMPHTREKIGEVLPLQTPQAFTNRALRVRVPNQMPTSKPKNGSAAYKKEILRNLEKRNAKTTEDLPTLNQPQIAKARKANKGKFAENSRYVVNKDEGSRGMPPPSSRKRKVQHDDDTEPEEDLEAPEAKRQRTQTPFQMGVELPGPSDLAPGSVGDDVDADTFWEGANLYNAPPNSATMVNDQAEQFGPAQTTGQFQDHYENGLVLLFSTIIDRDCALAVDPTFTSPAAVRVARQLGYQLDGINVDWYGANVSRHVEPDGSVVEGVAHIDSYDQIVSLGGFNDDSQGTFQSNGAYNATSSLAQDDGAFNDDSQGTFQSNGAYNATSSFAQDDGAFNDDSQGTFQSNGAYNATSSLAQDDGASNDDSQGTFQGNGAYNAPLSFAQDDGTYDATSPFPQGDIHFDVNTFYNQNGFGGNSYPLPQIPTDPLPTLQTQPTDTQQSGGYETQPDIFDEVWQGINSPYGK